MTPFNHILVPTDFGEAAERALDVAIALAGKFDSRLTVLHASWLPSSAYFVYAEALTWPTDELAKAAHKALDELLAKAKGAYPKTQAVMVTGEAWQTILEQSKERGADLIVMGTHGRRGLSRLLLGSVAESVVRCSPIPVVTICGTAEQQAKRDAIGHVRPAK